MGHLVAKAAFLGNPKVTDKELEPGREYLLVLVGRGKGVNATVYNGEVRIGDRFYDSFTVFAEAWDFGDVDTQTALLNGEDKERAEELFKEGKEQAARCAELLNELNAARAECSDCKKTLQALETSVNVDHENMSKVTEDLNKKLKTALEEANQGREEIADLTDALEDATKRIASLEAENRELEELNKDLQQAALEDTRTVRRLSVQNADLSSALKNLSIVAMRVSNS